MPSAGCLRSDCVCSFNLLTKEALSLSFSLQVAMAAVDSFYLLYREIARSCNCYMEALALVGAWYTARKSITVICDFYSLIRLHFIPRLGSRADLIKQYGRWAVVSGNLLYNQNNLFYEVRCIFQGAIEFNVMFLWEHADKKIKLMAPAVIMFTFSYCSHLRKNLPHDWYPSYSALSCSQASSRPTSYHLLFLFVLCFKIVFRNCHHFQKCFTYFEFHFNL